MLTSPSEVFKKVHELKERNESFVLATVVAVRGATSAKTGSKAIFDSRAQNILGWVGGGCAESFLARQALEVLELKSPRVVTVDLDDEVFGLMPCGGVMDVYLEPHFLAPEISVPQTGAWQKPITQFLAQLGFDAKVDAHRDSAISNWREAFKLMRNLLGAGKELKSLRRNAHSHEPLDQNISKIILLGQTRITEEICRMAKLIDFQVDLYAQNPSTENFVAGTNVCELPYDFDSVKISPESFVIVASHHQQDHQFVAHALNSGVPYVALVASQKRSGLVYDDLISRDLSLTKLANFFAPAGLNLMTDTPTQIAFSILNEILFLQKV